MGTAEHARACKSSTVGNAQLLGEVQKEEAVVEAKKLQEHLADKEKHGHCQPTERGEGLRNKCLTFPCPLSPSCHNQRKVRRPLHTVTFHWSVGSSVFPKQLALILTVPSLGIQGSTVLFVCLPLFFETGFPYLNSGWFQAVFSYLMLPEYSNYRSLSHITSEFSFFTLFHFMCMSVFTCMDISTPCVCLVLLEIRRLIRAWSQGPL